MSDIQYGIVNFSQSISEPRMFPYANDTTSGGNINKERNLVKLIGSLMNKSFAVSEGSYDIEIVSMEDGSYTDIKIAPGAAVVDGYYVESKQTITLSGNDGSGGDRFESIQLGKTCYVYLWLRMDGNGNNVLGANIAINENLPDKRDLHYLLLGELTRDLVDAGTNRTQLVFTPDANKYAMINLANLYNDKSLTDLQDSSLVQVIQQVTNNIISSGISGGTMVLNEMDGNPDRLVLKFGTPNGDSGIQLPDGKTDESYGIVQLVEQSKESDGSVVERVILQWSFGHITNKDFTGTGNTMWTSETPWVQENPMYYLNLWVDNLKCAGVFEAPGIVCTKNGITINSTMTINQELVVHATSNFNGETNFRKSVNLTQGATLNTNGNTVVDGFGKVYGAVWN